MKHRLLNLLTALSLLLCVAVVALWVRSFFVPEVFARYTYGPTGAGAFNRVRQVRSERGGMVLVDFTQYVTDPTFVAWSLSQVHAWELKTDPPGGPVGRSSSLSEILSFDVHRFSRVLPGQTDTGLGVRIPYWAPALAAAMPPVWWLARGRNWRRRDRKAKGLCVACGYDLTGNVSGVCPECGSRP